MHVFVDVNHQDGALMVRLADQWRDLLKGIRTHHIAHGDLQHGNVMVTPEGEFRLVDYEGMYVPGFGRGRSPELGPANYQHPRWMPEYYEEVLDNFAALVSGTSFLALAKEPKLWGEFSTGDNLLFVAAGFQTPQKSKIIERLKNSLDERVKLLSALAERACLCPVAMVPDFLETAELVAQGKLPVDRNAAAALISAATANWMTEQVPEALAGGSRSAPASSMGTRLVPASAGKRPPEQAKPVTTSVSSGTRPAEENRPAPVSASAPAPRVVMDPSGGLDPWVLGSVGLALLAFLPQLWLMVGAGSFVCGLVGSFAQARVKQEVNGWEWGGHSGCFTGYLGGDGDEKIALSGVDPSGGYDGSRRGPRPACAVDARAVGVWEVVTGEQVHRFSGHGAEVRSLSFFHRTAQILSSGMHPAVFLNNNQRMSFHAKTEFLWNV